MAWQTPKTNWKSSDVVSPTDMNRIEGNINSIVNDSRTIDPTQVPSGNVGILSNFLNWFANRIKAITGKTNWYDTPSKTLEDLNSHINNTNNPHAVTPAQIGAVNKAGDTMLGNFALGDNELRIRQPNDANHKLFYDNTVRRNRYDFFPGQGLIFSSFDGTTRTDIFDVENLKYKGNTVWHAGNDGAGSGLDADKLDGYDAGNADGNIPVSNGTVNTNLNADMVDGKHASDFVSKTGDTMTGNLTIPKLDFSNEHSIYLDEYGNIKAPSNIAPEAFWGVSNYNSSLRLKVPLGSDGGPVQIDGNTVWHAGNDGAGSGLDADKLDGLHASSFSTLTSFSAGNIILASNNSTTATSVSSKTPTKIKQFQLGLGGTIRISFNLKANANTAYGQIYRNGTAVGTLQSTTSSSFVTFTQDIAGWSIGDLVQLYIWGSDTFTIYNNSFTISVSYAPIATIA